MLKIGFSRVDVTPPLGTFVSGYFEERFADGILDPIFLNAIAIGNETEQILIITSDFLGIREQYATKIRRLIAERTGIDADHIMITALHQHTSICLRDDPRNNVMEDHEYLQILYRKFADVAQMAINDMIDATVCYGEKESEKPISFVRRYLMPDGSVCTNPKPAKCKSWPPIGPTEQSDNTVRLLKFIRKDGKNVALVNFSTHPDVVKGTKYSADWPGFVRRFVEAEHPNTLCLLLNGCQGDTNHKNFMIPENERFPVGERYPHAEYMGRIIANSVNDLWDQATEMNDQTLAANMTIVYNKTRTDKEEFFDECWDLYEAYQLKNDHSTDKTPSGISLAEASRVVRTRTEAPLYQKIPVTVLRVGEIGFVGFGGEPFTHYATAVRENFPGKTVIAACCANGFQGYLPTAKAFEQGGYEAVSSPFSPNLEEDCTKAAVEILQKMKF
ncbi:MAG: hypothetical protein E7637_03270 [Ruminococcaceae bacterium]|nr:hypothetical protein [Oscillospiraceae bacterium]